MTKKVYRSSCKVPTRYSCQILIKLEYSYRFSKNTQISNFMKIRGVGAEMFRAEGRRDTGTDGRTDGRIDMTKLIVALRNIAYKQR